MKADVTNRITRKYIVQYHIDLAAAIQPGHLLHVSFCTTFEAYGSKKIYSLGSSGPQFYKTLGFVYNTAECRLQMLLQSSEMNAGAYSPLRQQDTPPQSRCRHLLVSHRITAKTLRLHAYTISLDVASTSMKLHINLTSSLRRSIKASHSIYEDGNSLTHMWMRCDHEVV
jgi:hypothetical protein